MEQPSQSLAFVSYEPCGGKQRNRRAREVRVHAGKVGWLKSSKAAQIEARRKQTRKACKDEDVGDETKDVELLPRAVAPVFGGVSLKTFDAAEDGISKRISYLMLSAVWPNVAGESVAAPWFVDFCNDPLMFHTHCTAGAMYRDVLAQKSEWGRGKTALTHKGKTLSLIKSSLEALESLSQVEIERLVLSMGILGVHEFDPEHVQHKPLPFKPFHPAANWISLWGRSDPIEAHLQAAFALVLRLGGPKALLLPGLGYMTSLSDIFFAACHLRRPVFRDCYWDDVHILDVLPDEWCRPALDICDERPPLPGGGFADLPGGLPPTALSVLTEVAYTDKVLAESNVKDHPTNPVQRVRLATCQRLLSLPSWDEMEDEGDPPDHNAYDTPSQTDYRGKSHRAVYEICRLTCVIYANACFFPLPPHNGWNIRLTSRAMDLLDMANFDMWTLEIEGLYLWVLIICGMAAFDTMNRQWFENALGSYARRRSLSIDYTLGQVRRFAWSDSVCEAGAIELWDAAMTAQQRPSPAGVNVKLETIPLR